LIFFFLASSSRNSILNTY